jgi:hypothetical protein
MEEVMQTSCMTSLPPQCQRVYRFGETVRERTEPEIVLYEELRRAS